MTRPTFASSQSVLTSVCLNHSTKQTLNFVAFDSAADVTGRCSGVCVNVNSSLAAKLQVAWRGAGFVFES